MINRDLAHNYFYDPFGYNTAICRIFTTKEGEKVGCHKIPVENLAELCRELNI